MQPSPCELSGRFYRQLPPLSSGFKNNECRKTVAVPDLPGRIPPPALPQTGLGPRVSQKKSRHLISLPASFMKYM